MTSRNSRQLDATRAAYVSGAKSGAFGSSDMMCATHRASRGGDDGGDAMRRATAAVVPRANAAKSALRNTRAAWRGALRYPGLPSSDPR